MATTTKTVNRLDLPLSIPIRIHRGDTFFSPVYRHKNADGTYRDTSAWTKTAKLYERQACGAAEVTVGGAGIQVIDQPSPEFGYQLKIDAADTAGLTCANRWYEIEVNDGTTTRTYFGGPAKITGVGDA